MVVTSNVKLRMTGIPAVNLVDTANRLASAAARVGYQVLRNSKFGLTCRADLLPPGVPQSVNSAPSPNSFERVTVRDSSSFPQTSILRTRNFAQAVAPPGSEAKTTAGVTKNPADVTVGFS